MILAVPEVGPGAAARCTESSSLLVLTATPRIVIVDLPEMEFTIRPKLPFLLIRKFHKKGIDRTIAQVRYTKQVVAPAGLASCPFQRIPENALLDLLGRICSVVRVRDHRLPKRHRLGSLGVGCVTRYLRSASFGILLLRCSDGANPTFGIRQLTQQPVWQRFDRQPVQRRLA